ncbi:LysR family transcriptional regulator [Streptomyces sp. NPDC088921]|uniref:LysR family transcriptional regulator n=1 Tax=unclassified Streptomyces TaxID=2593676 RepID=UPI0034457471
MSPEDLDIRRVRCFVAAVEMSGFVRAASRLHTTQPALSRWTGHRKRSGRGSLPAGRDWPTA